MLISDKISPSSIAIIEDFPGFASKCEAGVMAFEIVKEAQKDNKWPTSIPFSKLEKVMNQKMSNQKYVNYSFEAIRVFNLLGYIVWDGENIVLQEAFAEALISSFPA